MQGAIFSGIDVRDYKGVYVAKEESFPKSFELKMVRIKNQESVGSCVAHSLSTVIEYYNNQQNGDPTEMSIGYIYGNRTTSKHKGVGMVVRDALEAIRLYGDVYKETYFETDNVEVPLAIDLFEDNKINFYSKGYIHRISQYFQVNTVSAIKASLMAGNPVVMAMEWYSDMKVVDGILTTSRVGYDGGHCMLIYGWDERGWKVQNSWGDQWGDNGTVIIPYDMKINECWALTDDIIEGLTVQKPFMSKLGKIVARIINVFCKIFYRA